MGDVFQVTRQIPVQNNLADGPWHLMKITLGEIRVYAVGESTAVGHVEIEREPSSLPSMEFQTFMLGDEVELKEIPVRVSGALPSP